MKQGPKEFLESKIRKLGTTEMAGIALSNVSLSINATKSYYGEPEPYPWLPEAVKEFKIWLDVSVPYPIWRITEYWPCPDSNFTFYRTQGRVELIAQVPRLDFGMTEELVRQLQNLLFGVCQHLGVDPGPIHLHIALVTMDWGSALPNTRKAKLNSSPQEL